MNTNTMDYSEYAEKVSTDKLAQLADLAQQQARLESEHAELERQLALKAEELKLLSEKTLPELMDELTMEEFTTRTGLKIKIAEAIRASIPKARQGEAITWLNNHGFANLVKRKFVVQFSKDEESWANKFAADLAKRKRQLNVSQDSDVHNQTLRAFIREQLEAGTEIPLDLFGVFRQRYAKVEVRK